LIAAPLALKPSRLQAVNLAPKMRQSDDQDKRWLKSGRAPPTELSLGRRASRETLSFHSIFTWIGEW
jgi:hypothetical protein